MKIILYPHPATAWVDEYFTFNQMPYTKLDPFDPEVDVGGRYTLDHAPLKESGILFIIEGLLLTELLEWPTSKQQLLDFCANGNKLWIWNRVDGLAFFLRNSESKLEFDKQVTPGTVTWFFDATPLPDSVVHQLTNSKFKIFPYNFFTHLTKIYRAKVDKVNCTYDYMLTMYRKRVHREALWNQLHNRPDLTAKGKLVYHRSDPNNPDSVEGTNWVGHKHPQCGWNEGHPSMDLYLDAWVEVVPETFYKDGWFMTEKTAKPIGTKTPFLMLSTPGYLKYLHNLGFQTFGSLIDESYDQIVNVDDRTTALLNQLEYISKNGAKDFYHASQSILDHNHNVMCEITGKWTYVMDLFLEENLNAVGIK